MAKTATKPTASKSQATKPTDACSSVACYEIGKNYFIRTVTNYFTGKLVAVHPQELVVTDAAWIADTGRLAEFVARGTPKEVEVYPDGQPVIIGRGAIIDATAVSWPLPRKTSE